jgi:hypothetical protein
MKWKLHEDEASQAPKDEVDHEADDLNQGPGVMIMDRTSIKIKNDTTTMISNLAEKRAVREDETHEKQMARETGEREECHN